MCSHQAPANQRLVRMALRATAQPRRYGAAMDKIVKMLCKSLSYVNVDGNIYS